MHIIDMQDINIRESSYGNFNILIQYIIILCRWAGGTKDRSD